MKKLSLQPFTLEDAQKGRTIVTRDCKEVRYIALNPGVPAPVVVEVLMNADDKDELGKDWQPHWQLENYETNGSYLGFVEDNMDLFISPFASEEIGRKPTTNEKQLSIN